MTNINISELGYKSLDSLFRRPWKRKGDMPLPIVASACEQIQKTSCEATAQCPDLVCTCRLEKFGGSNLQVVTRTPRITTSCPLHVKLLKSSTNIFLCDSFGKHWSSPSIKISLGREGYEFPQAFVQADQR